MKKLLFRQLTLLCLASLLASISHAKNYPVSDIPAELTGADAVIRYSKQVFEIKSPGRAVETNTFVITILKKKALDYAKFREPYSDLLKIKNIKAVYYDKNGRFIKNISKDDIHDVSAISNSSLYSDDRIIYFEPVIKNLPFTFEVTYTKKYDGLLFYPDWTPFPGYDIAIEHPEFTVVTQRNTDSGTKNKASKTSQG